MDNKHLYGILQIEPPELVLEEVMQILNLISPQIDTESIESWFEMTVDLYTGKYPGYKACNTLYHDLTHTIDTFLAMARLIHGSVIDGKTFSNRDILLGLKAALLHDSGYIQEEDDNETTGAVHTSVHVPRSMNFFKLHGSVNDLSDGDVESGRSMILYTDLEQDGSNIPFPSARVELLGKFLAAADLMAQASDRIYLEKLLLLYGEFKEGKIEQYESEEDLLKKTIGFYDFINHRIKMLLKNIDRYMSLHFVTQWGIYQNLYSIAMDKQKKYLKMILKRPGSPLQHLKRGGIVKKVMGEKKDMGEEQ